MSIYLYSTMKNPNFIFKKYHFLAQKHFKRDKEKTLSLKCIS